MKKFIQRNKTLFFIFIITILFISSITVYAYSSITSYKPNYGTLTANVNFRTTASTSTGKIRTLSKGTAVKMVATIDNFYIVQLGTNEVGVVSKSYVKSSSSAPNGAKTYTSIGTKNATTTAKVNLRRGPGTNFAKVTTLSKGTSLKAVGYIDNWYIVVTKNNQVGCIRKDLLKLDELHMYDIYVDLVESDNNKISFEEGKTGVQVIIAENNKTTIVDKLVNFRKEDKFRKEDVSFAVGDHVSHPDFGSGVVVMVDKTLVTIAFPHPYGVKKMMKNHLLRLHKTLFLQKIIRAK